MTFPLRALVGASALMTVLWTSAAAADSARPQWHADIGTGYTALAKASDELATTTRDYCTSPGADGHARASEAWQKAFRAWQRVRYVDFGPIEQNSLAWQFQFWPDSKNLIAQKSKRWIAGDQPITAARLSTDSVAVKGLPAMEYLLFERASAEKNLESKGCELLIAVGEHNQANARQLMKNWQAFGPHYMGDAQYDSTIIIAAMHALEIIKDARIGGPIGTKGAGKRNPWLADAWRSGQSLRAIEATLRGLEQSFLPGLAQHLQTMGKAEPLEPFQRQLSRTLERLADMPDDMTPLLKSDDGYRSLQLLQLDVERLATQLSGIAADLGIVRGFNSSDGD